MVPAAVTRGIRQDIDPEILIVIVSPEIVAYSTPAAQPEAVRLIGRLVTPKDDLAAAASPGRNTGRIDPRLDGERLIVFGNALTVEGHVVAAPIKAQRIGR